MLTLLLALSTINPADACAMPRSRVEPVVAEAVPKVRTAVESPAPAAPVPQKSLEEVLADIEAAAVIPEVSAPAAAPPTSKPRS